MGAAVRAADLFCGAGGSSTGLTRCCARLGRRLQLLAVNHWPVAVETHAANHPGAKHLCMSLESVDPRKEVPGGRLDLLLAGPECTHHSVARGGKPVNDQSRATAWHVIRWAEALRPRVVIVENVREFRTWGPLGSDGKPLKSRRGETFAAWLQALRSLGYRAEHRVLNAADYGDATTRERLFVVGVRGRRPFRWPQPTHSRDGGASLFGRLPRWRAAREVIDWSLRGTSIFGRKTPLRPKTLARIAAGLSRFGGHGAAPFLLLLTHGGRLHDCARPLPTVTGANRGELALVQPFTVQFKGTAADQIPHTARSIDQPLGTITAGGGNFGLVEPFLVPYRGERGGQSPRCHSVDRPLPTVTTEPAFALCEPFVLQLSQSGSNGPRMRKTDRPLPTITSADDLAVIEPFLVKYQGTGGPRPLTEPLDTVTTRDRFGLVQPAALDILFRMLQPHELAAAMSFPQGYKFSGNRGEVVRQIGNAWPGGLAESLSAAALEVV